LSALLTPELRTTILARGWAAGVGVGRRRVSAGRAGVTGAGVAGFGVAGFGVAGFGGACLGVASLGVRGFGFGTTLGFGGV
jgi:hypothetical protein